MVCIASIALIAIRNVAHVSVSVLIAWYALLHCAAYTAHILTTRWQFTHQNAVTHASIQHKGSTKGYPNMEHTATPKSGMLECCALFCVLHGMQCFHCIVRNQECCACQCFRFDCMVCIVSLHSMHSSHANYPMAIHTSKCSHPCINSTQICFFTIASQQTCEH